MPIQRMEGDIYGQPPIMPDMNCPKCGCGSFSIQNEDGKRGARCMNCRTWAEVIDWETAAPGQEQMPGLNKEEAVP